MRAFLAFLLILFSLSSVTPAMAQQETPDEERSMFLGFVEDQLSGPNRQIRIQNIEGVLSSNARIGLITVADNEGVWLRITDASIVWSRSALLFSQRLQIDRLAAARIEVLRRPLPDESLPAPETSSFQLPELPIGVNLDELDAPFVSFGQDVFGLESELSLTGRLSLEDGSLDTVLDINRLDGPGGHLALSAAYANSTEQLDLDLQVSEPENGVIANLVGIEGRPKIDLAVKGSGPLSGLDINLALDAAGERVLTGRTALRRQDAGLGYDAQFSGPIAQLVPGQFRAFFGAQTALNARGLVRDAGGVVLEALNLDSAALNLTASAETGLDGFLRQLNLDARLANGADGRIILPVPGGDTTVENAALQLSFGETTDGRWSGLFSASNFATTGFQASDVQLDLGGIARDIERADARSISFAARGAVSGIVATHSDWNEALGNEIRLNIDGDWQAGAPVRLADASVSGNGLTAALAGAINDFIFNGDITVKAANIAPFSGLAGRPLQGALDLQARGTVALLNGGFDLTIDSAAQDLATGIDAADRLLAGRSTITGRVSRGEDGLSTQNLRIGNDRIELVANGGIATEGTDFSYTLALSDLNLLTPRAAGRLEAQGTAKGTQGLINLSTLAQVPSGSLAGKRLTEAKIAFDGALEDGALDGTIGGDAFLDGVRARLSAGIAVNNEEKRLSDLDFTAGGARATGALTQDAQGLIDGAIRIDAADISTVAALFLAQASGALEADIAFAAESGKQKATIRANARSLKIDETRLDHAEIEAAIADLFGVPAIDGALTAQGLAAGGVIVSKLDATAKTSGDKTEFAADAALANGASARARGSLAPENDGYRLVLSEASLGQGPLVARLVEQASLRVAGDTVAIDSLVLDVGGGRVSARGNVARTIDLAVSIARLPLSIANLVKPDLELGGTLDGEAIVSGPRDNPNARFNLTGEAITAAALRQAGQSTLSLRASGQGSADRLTIDASATTPEGLRASANGVVPLSGAGLAVNFSGSAPLALANRFLADRGTQLSGVAEASGSVSGSLANPAIRASFSTSNAEAVDPDSNLRLRNINVTGAIDGMNVTLSSASAALSAGGTVSANGTILLDADAGFPADLRVALNQARYADGDMVVATVNGNLAMSGPLTRDPLLSGNVAVERAEISVPESLGGSAAMIDVINLNTPATVQKTLARARANDGTPVPDARPSSVRLDVTVQAPARIFVRGRGLDAELGGSVRLTGPVTDIQPVGGFSLIRGRLSILGQRITFDEGTVSLVGDLDPYLDFVARSAGNEITVFVTVRGRVSDLAIGFSSQPELPEDEVLARLIFNRSLSELSALQIAQLAAAAAELAGGANTSLLGSLRGATGLDDLDIVTDSEGNAAVRAGRYIQDNIYLGVEAGAQGTTRGSINLDITEDLKARGSMGSDGDSSLGIFYERDY